MKRWLSRGQAANDVASDYNEVEALQDAMRATVLVMNDEYDQADALLTARDSPFHKLGLGCVCFLKAVMGMQKPDIERAIKVLADAEASATEYQKQALSNASIAHQSAIYPLGTEYALANAEAQLMYAVCAILNAGWAESLKGLLKIRKAWATLQDIVEHEKRYLKSKGQTASSLKAASIRPTSKASSAVAPAPALAADADDSDDDFQDAEEELTEEQHHQNESGQLPAIDKLSLNGGSHRQASLTGGGAENDFDFRTVSDHPVDLFIHAGVGLSFGTMQLILSLIPPPFDKILSMFSFSGERKVGLDLLWGSARFIDDINGALAGLIALVFYNGPIAFANIKLASDMPLERLQVLLHDIRQLYPRSQIWQLEEAIMLSEARQLNSALKVLENSHQSPLASIQSMGYFEVGLHHLYAHRYEECASDFMKLLQLSEWSHGLYYYVAAICYVELYRVTLTTDPALARKHADQAVKYFDSVLPNTGKKKVLGRELPIETFIKRKISKYMNRAKERKCSIVDAIGVSPAEDIIYFWGGYDCMPDDALQVSLERLAWAERQATWSSEGPDERSTLSCMRATCLRVMGQLDKAKVELEQGCFVYTPQQVKNSCRDADQWAIATAHYEMAVCYWQEAGGETGDKVILQKCADEIHKISKWGSHELESVNGLKVSTAAHTLKGLGLHV